MNARQRRVMHRARPKPGTRVGWGHPFALSLSGTVKGPFPGLHRVWVEVDECHGTHYAILARRLEIIK